MGRQPRRGLRFDSSVLTGGRGGRKAIKNRPFYERLGFALAGLRACWQGERSFRTHVLAAFGALGLLLWMRPDAIWWGLIALVTALVLALELLNSALEGLVDHLHPDRHPEIKRVKDMAAAAVLVLSMAALAIAAAMLSQYL